MKVKDAAHFLSGASRLSLARQRLSFRRSSRYWESRYLNGGDSGAGADGSLAHAKAFFLNYFVRLKEVGSVTEFGCGDGWQLALAEYPLYTGLDVSASAIRLCANRCNGDHTTRFFRYDPGYFVDGLGLFCADLAISLDVIYHLVKDGVFAAYMTYLFAAGRRYVMIYATNQAMPGTAPHVWHRAFAPWVDRHCPGWGLSEVVPGQYPRPPRPDFFVYERLTRRADHP